MREIFCRKCLFSINNILWSCLVPYLSIKKSHTLCFDRIFADAQWLQFKQTDLMWKKSFKLIKRHCRTEEGRGSETQGKTWGWGVSGRGQRRSERRWSQPGERRRKNPQRLERLHRLETNSTEWLYLNTNIWPHTHAVFPTLHKQINIRHFSYVCYALSSLSL